MKSWLAVAGTGVGLFTVTAVGTLALRGRLGGDAADRVPFVANLLDGEAPAGVPEEAALRDPVAGPPMPLAETAPETPEAAAEARSAVPTVFRFEGLLPDLSEDELDRMVDELLAARSEVEDQRAALRTEWDAYQSRLADLEEREARITERMMEVDRAREELDAAIARFERDVLIARRSEKRGLFDLAGTLGSLPAERAASLVLGYWGDDAQRDTVTKVLALMDVDDVAAILTHVRDDQLREILTARLRVVVEPEK